MQYWLDHRKKPQKFSLLRWIAALVLLGGTLSAGVFIVYDFWHDNKEVGQFNISDTYIGENLSRSLDLKLAAKASYPSSELGVYKDLGNVDGLHQKIFSFSVEIDKLTEYGLMVEPVKTPPPVGFPVIILLHGYSNASRYSTQDGYLSDMEFYASHGFAVIKPDYRGQGVSEDSGLPDSAYYSMVYNDDVMSLISAIKQTPSLDKSNINIWGHSLGAYLGLRAAVLSKDIKNLILLSGPVDSLRAMYLNYVPPSDENNTYALATRNEVFTKYGTPADNTRFWYDASPINFVSQIHAFIQIHVGLLDQTVPPQFSADLDAALSRSHIKHQYFVYQDGDHSLVNQRPLIYSRSLQLLMGGTNASNV
ncbi:MAG: alpha/beta hydrolase family protein [Candidatus Saccharimonadales bacterium]